MRPDYESCVNLWRGVLKQSMFDEIAEYSGYFKTDNPDFLLVCDYAQQRPIKMIECYIRFKAKVCAAGLSKVTSRDAEKLYDEEIAAFAR